MRKNIGKEGNQVGQYDAMRLAKELEEIKIELFEIDPEDGSIFLTFEDALEEQVGAVCAAHVPKPLPAQPTENEVLREEIAMLDGALNELLFEIIPGMGGSI